MYFIKVEVCFAAKCLSTGTTTAIQRVRPIALQPSIPQTTATGHSIRPLGRILERTTIQIGHRKSSFSLKGKSLLLQSTCTMHMTTKVPKNTTFCLQRAVISFLIISMGDDMMKIGEKSRPGLRNHAKEAAAKYVPNRGKAYRTAERWFPHYLKYGETPWETKKWKSILYRGERRRTWTVDDSLVLKRLVDDNPGLYLDELVTRLHEETQVRWAHNTIWLKIRNELKYSLQRVAEKALEQDNLE
jgi:hypothetical protein